VDTSQPLRHVCTTHFESRHWTLPTPGMVVQSVPDLPVNCLPGSGNTHPPQESKDVRTSIHSYDLGPENPLQASVPRGHRRVPILTCPSKSRLLGAWDGHELEAEHCPLQRVKPSRQLNPQVFCWEQVDTVLDGYTQDCPPSLTIVVKASTTEVMLTNDTASSVSTLALIKSSMPLTQRQPDTVPKMSGIEMPRSVLRRAVRSTLFKKINVSVVSAFEKIAKRMKVAKRATRGMECIVGSRSW